jgi:hypothetical protein
MLYPDWPIKTVPYPTKFITSFTDLSLYLIFLATVFILALNWAFSDN